MLSKGLAVDAADEEGDTLRALAAMSGASKCARVLLAAGADVNLPVGKCQRSILSIAAGRGQEEWVRLLISHGAKVNATDCNGETPLIRAVKVHSSAEERCGQVACVSLLLQAGANPLQADKSRNTPLSQAESGGNRPVCCLLRQASAAEKTPLMQAVWEGDTDKLGRALAQSPGKIKRILGKKSGVNQADTYGYTPLHVAALPGREACLPILLAAGAKPDARDRENITPLALATESANKEAVQALLAAGAKPDLADDEGVAPLLQAVIMKQTEMCKLLLAAGADPNEADLS